MYQYPIDFGAYVSATFHPPGLKRHSVGCLVGGLALVRAFRFDLCGMTGLAACAATPDGALEEVEHSVWGPQDSTSAGKAGSRFLRPLQVRAPTMLLPVLACRGCASLCLAW